MVIKKKVGGNIKEDVLINSILKGTPGAARSFYFKYHRAVEYFVRTKCKSKEDAEEIVQDVFLSAIDSLGIYSGRSSLISWLYGIARHEISDYYRKKRVKILVLSKAPLLAELLGDEKWSEQFAHLALREEVKRILGRLLPRYEQLLRMKYLEGWSVEDMARELDESFKATETALFRARKAFALEWSKLYEKQYHFE
jgi:RNA polymerase sigma-70 factor (ECF subfamily)